MFKMKIPREKGEGLRNIENTGRWNYSSLARILVSIYWLGFYVLILLSEKIPGKHRWVL